MPRVINATRCERQCSIENEIIFGRVYKLYNNIDHYIYIGSTTLPLTKRLGDHMYSYNKNIEMEIYKHMRRTGLSNWTIKLLEGKVVDNIADVRVLEQTLTEKENPKYLLNFKNAAKENDSLNKIRKKLENFNI